MSVSQNEVGARSDVVYHIYPATFEEGVRPDGQPPIGIGNLRGITGQLENGYLPELGVDRIYLSPFYPSPLADGGYDISNFTDVDPRYGTLGDFSKMVETAHGRGIKVWVDLIPNHTSDQHPWFRQSRDEPDGPYGDFYTWRDAKPDGSPPNKWGSVFSLPQLEARRRGDLDLPEDTLTPPVSAWTYSARRHQFYNHTFMAEQPDLNWHNPEVRKAMQEVMRFWLRAGVDGFRVDAVPHIGKDPDLHDEELNPNYRDGIDNPYDQLKRHYSAGYPPTFHKYVRELTDVMEEPEFANRDRIIFEAYMEPDEIRALDAVAPEIASSFFLSRMQAPWIAETHKDLLDDYYANLPAGAVANQVLGNHDNPRAASRLGQAAARSAALLNLTLPGLIFVYNGEEGGFTDVEVPPERRRDPQADRDPERTPMLWNDKLNAGFSQADPGELWLPVDPDYREKNLARQAKDPASSLNLYKELIHLRKTMPVLLDGRYEPLDADHSDVLAFARQLESDRTVTIVNFSDAPVKTRLGQAGLDIGRVLLSSDPDRELASVRLDETITLRPHEGILVGE